METERVKYLREKHGIVDSRNQYTEGEILEAINSEALFFSYVIDVLKGNIHFYDRKFNAYKSKDGCVWIKDSLFSDDNTYVQATNCSYEYKNDDDIIVYNCFFFNKEYDECFSIIKEKAVLDLKKVIARHQDIVINLQGELEKISS